MLWPIHTFTVFLATPPLLPCGNQVTLLLVLSIVTNPLPKPYAFSTRGSPTYSQHIKNNNNNKKSPMIDCCCHASRTFFFFAMPVSFLCLLFQILLQHLMRSALRQRHKVRTQCESFPFVMKVFLCIFFLSSPCHEIVVRNFPYVMKASATFHKSGIHQLLYISHESIPSLASIHHEKIP